MMAREVDDRSAEGGSRQVAALEAVDVPRRNEHNFVAGVTAFFVQKATLKQSTMASGTSDGDATSGDRELAELFRRTLVLDTHILRNLIRRGHWLSARMLVGIGNVPTLVEIRQGVPSVWADVPLLCAWDFSVRGTPRAWAGLWSPFPEPGWHDLFALAKRGELQIEGNLHPFMAGLQYYKDLLTMPRETMP
jgi:hypothetical protein